MGVNRESISGIAATGYGKQLIPEATVKVDEITANANGVHLLGGIEDAAPFTIINIGGQDVKIIKSTGDGKVEDFKMNDKCAAGTGRFFEMAARLLDTPVGDFGELGLTSTNPAFLNSICAVFAET